MSGGSMNYLFRDVAEAKFEVNTPERRAFKRHLLGVAEALRNIERVDSSDANPGDENKAIRDCIGPHRMLDSAIMQAHEAQAALDAAIENAKTALSTKSKRRRAKG